MSDASRFSNKGRALTQPEFEFLMELLAQFPAKESLSSQIREARVWDLEDGGMHSFRFTNSEGITRDTTLCKATFLDSDGVLVSLELSVDTLGRLFELDMWKVDFTAVRHLPLVADLTFGEVSAMK